MPGKPVSFKPYSLKSFLYNWFIIDIAEVVPVQRMFPLSRSDILPYTLINRLTCLLQIVGEQLRQRNEQSFELVLGQFDDLLEQFQIDKSIYKSKMSHNDSDLLDIVFSREQKLTDVLQHKLLQLHILQVVVLLDIYVEYVIMVIQASIVQRFQFFVKKELALEEMASQVVL